MLPKMPAIDIAILLGYLIGIVVFANWFVRRSRSAEQFTTADRALPGWAVGLSIFGSYISSISFLANPGKSYAGNWNPFAFSLATPIAAWVAVRFFVPFYRRHGEVSAYHHLEHRFGPWARTYAVICFLLTQMARMGTIVYLLALALAPLTGWKVSTIIILTGGLMTVYTLLGGIEAAVWAGVAQSLVLIVGWLACISALLFALPEGPSQIFSLAAAHGKFQLGSFAPSLTQATFWVVFLYGFVTHLQNFGIDQSYVQRYITARSDGDAARSVWVGTWLYVPMAAGFFFIGTSLFALYTVRPDWLPAASGAATPADTVFPHFIATQLPVGITGLVIAAIFAAAMDSNLNSMATLTLYDIYKRYLHPQAGERESLQVLRLATLGWGILGTAVALAMIRVRSALDAWWEMASIFSGGMLGLFLLGMISRRATHATAALAVTIGVLVILWMTLSPTANWPEALAGLKSPFHSFLIMVIGTLSILLIGLVATQIRRAKGPVE